MKHERFTIYQNIMSNIIESILVPIISTSLLIFIASLFLYKVFFKKNHLPITLRILAKMSFITTGSVILLLIFHDQSNEWLGTLSSTFKNHGILYSNLATIYYYFSLIIIPAWIYIISKKLLLKYSKTSINSYRYDHSKHQINKHALLVVLWVLWVLLCLFLLLAWFLSAAFS